MNDPWTFGWTQLLMIAGLALTGVVSILGLPPEYSARFQKGPATTEDPAEERHILTNETGVS